MTTPLKLVPPAGFSGPPQWSIQGWNGFTELADGIRSRASDGAAWPGSIDPDATAIEDGILTLGVGGAVCTYGVFETPPGKLSVVRVVAMQANSDAGGWGSTWFLGGPGAPQMPEGDIGEIDLNESGMVNRTTQSGSTFLGHAHPNAYAASTFHPGLHSGRQYPYGYNANVDLSKTWHYWDMIYNPGTSVTTKIDNERMALWTPSTMGGAPHRIKNGSYGSTPFPKFPYSLILDMGAADQPVDEGWHTVGPATDATMKIASIGAWW